MTTARKQHIDDASLVAAVQRAPAVPVVRHLASCDRCHRLLSALAVLRDEHASDPSPCPDPVELVLYAEAEAGTSSPGIERHLAACRECAFDVERLARVQLPTLLPRSSGRRRARRPALVERFRTLLSFDMPPYLALVARGARSAPAAHGAPIRAALADYRAGRFDAAVKRLRAARVRATGAADLDHRLGVCLVRAKRLGQAIDAFQRAVESKPRIGEYRFNLAQALLLAGETQQARDELERATRCGGAFAERARTLASDVEHTLAPRRRRV